MCYSLSELHLVIKLVQRSENAHLKHYLTFFKKQLHTQAYRSGHNEAVLKTSFVFLCNFLKTLDFIGFFGGRLAFCEKPFSQFSRNFLT